MGWTIDRQIRFLISLAETGSVTQASRSVGMSPRAAYHLRMRAGHDDFRRAWVAAINQAWLNLQSVAMDRALNGTTRQIWKDGELVAEQTVPSDRLLIWLMTHLDVAPDMPPFLNILSVLASKLNDDSFTLPPHECDNCDNSQADRPAGKPPGPVK
jgi:hypothetical protein